MTADALLSRLDAVKHTGSGRWIARCPAHDDRKPSLAIHELDDGRVLVKCFAECDTENVLAAVGLTFDALFPPKAIDHHRPRERRPFNANDVLVALETELTIASLAVFDIARGATPTDSERERLLIASRRIRAAIDLAVQNA